MYSNVLSLISLLYPEPMTDIAVKGLSLYFIRVNFNPLTTQLMKAAMENVAFFIALGQ